MKFQIVTTDPVPSGALLIKSTICAGQRNPDVVQAKLNYEESAIMA